jgi:hypothetical protein
MRQISNNEEQNNKFTVMAFNTGITPAICNFFTGSEKNKYQFNGIEKNTDLGLNTYEALFRT